MNFLCLDMLVLPQKLLMNTLNTKSVATRKKEDPPCIKVLCILPHIITSSSHFCTVSGIGII